MKRDEWFRLDALNVSMQMHIPEALETDLSKYTISLQLTD